MLLALLGCRHGLPETPPSPTAAAPAPQGAIARPAVDGIGAFVDRYCVGCHGPDKKKGGITLHLLRDEAAVRAQPALWRDVLERVESGDMPPDDSLQPTDDERLLLAGWLEGRVFACDKPARPRHRMNVRRLNRTEFESSVRDLLGVSVPLAAMLPPDNSGHGFDNMAEALTTSPLLVERYLEAADRALATVVFDPELARPRRLQLRAEAMDLGGNPKVQRGGWVRLSSRDEDEVSTDVAAPAEATFVVKVLGHVHPEPPRPPRPDAPPEPAQRADRVPLRILIDDEVRATIEVTAKPGAPAVYEAGVVVPPGHHRLRVAVLKDKGRLSAFERAIPRLGKSLPAAAVIKTVEIQGPVGPTLEPTEAHRRLFFRAPARRDNPDAARAIFGRFATRAFRRPAKPEELDRLVALAAQGWNQGLSFEAGVRLGLRAVLVSPQFLFRHEVELAGHTDYALAARLAYFLWSTIPDDELLAHAAQGTLRANLRAQVARMLDHPKAQAFVAGFGGQWLEFRNMENAGPAPQRFKTWNEDLRHSMRRETELLFEHVLRNDGSALDILGAQYTFVNERLARHYGLEGVAGEAFQKVSLVGTPRRGVLTHGSVLTLTSNPTRTSPVKRGKWVLEALLNTPPPPPPPNVPSLADGRRATGTVRERLEQHRDDPGCASCHARMDPIGFGLERFDGIGAYREKDNEEPIDTKGTLTSGESFDGALTLVEILLEKKRDQYLRALAAKMLAYALGRGLEPDERCTVLDVVGRAAQDQHRLGAFVAAVAESAPFLDTKE